MVIVEVRLSPEDLIYPDPDRVHRKLATGKLPFHDSEDTTVVIMISKGKRPQKPAHFDAPGITQAVWRVAKKCWHESAKERPGTKEVIQELKNIASPGLCTN